MKILSLLSACEPTKLLQTVLSAYVKINPPNNGIPYCQTLVQGSLLTVAAITGVGACASEGLTLVADLFCKGCKKTVGAAQYVTGSEYLDRFYQFLPNRPPLSFRMERIVSQGLGIIVSVLGTLFLLAIKVDWAVRQHQSLGNYVRPKTNTNTGASAASSVAGQHAAPPPATGKPPGHNVDPRQAMANLLQNKFKESSEAPSANADESHAAAPTAPSEQNAARTAPASASTSAAAPHAELASDAETAKLPVSSTARPEHNVNAGRTYAAALGKKPANSSEAHSVAPASPAAAQHAAPAAHTAVKPPASPTAPSGQTDYRAALAHALTASRPAPASSTAAEQHAAPAAVKPPVPPTDLTAQNTARAAVAGASTSAAASTPSSAAESAAPSSRPPNQPPPPVPVSAPPTSSTTKLPPPPPPPPAMSLARALPRADDARNSLLAQIRAKGGQVTPVASPNQGPAAPRTGVWNTMVSFFGGNEGSPPPASPAQPTAAKSPASTSTSSPSSASAMGGSPNSPSRTAAPPLSPAAATSSDEKTPPVAPVSPAAANGKKPSTMARVFFGKVAGKRGILFEKTDYGFRLGGDWSLKDLKAYGLNFPATVDSDFDEDTIDSYLFNYNAKMAPKTGQKFDFNTGKKNEAFQIEVEKVSGISVDIVKVMVVTESKAGESGAQSASSN